MNIENKILHLTLKKKWFDMILSGEKKEEYREIKDFWSKRFLGPEWYKLEPEMFLDAYKNYYLYDCVKFARGGHFHISLPQMVVELKSIRTGNGKPEWGAEKDREYFVLSLGKILSISNIIQHL